jgi:hypothetical protein
MNLSQRGLDVQVSFLCQRTLLVTDRETTSSVRICLLAGGVNETTISLCRGCFSDYSERGEILALERKKEREKKRKKRKKKRNRKGWVSDGMAGRLTRMVTG